ncbi:MAG: hypothetical protein NDP13_03365 [Crenarchaeota archaeon]|nr:hypothetical protein [Thermoproteota archaeon]MCR8455168.1 hypothetical protein [Thermoproteota archaeon]MCR8471312.1 hypothetical protein [Thermoproteota archaeon]MCR8472481.1 hypothetical protein [Thermoproteota archaeon]MCR8473351.1 hypothetical protein [Thermoproteota archaeon]
MDKSFWAAIKLLLHPRAITIFDLELLSRNIKTDIKEIFKSERIDEITHLSLAALEPIAKFEAPYTTYVISKSSIERHIMLQKAIIERLLADGHIDLAEMFAFELIRMSYYFVTLYLVSSGTLVIPLEPAQVDFEQGALKAMISIFKDSKFLEITEKLGIGKNLDFSLKSLVQLVKSTINLLPSDSRERIVSELREYLEHPHDLETFYKGLEEALKSNIPAYLKRRIIIENAINYMLTVFRDELPYDGEKIKTIINIMRNIGDFAKSLIPEFKDIIWDAINVLTNVVARAYEGKTVEVTDLLSKFGEHILREGYLSIPIGERVSLRTPDDLKALTPTITVAPVNLTDIYRCINLNHIVNESISNLMDISSELKLILSMLTALNEDQLTDLLIKIHEDPLASLALNFSIGSTSSWLADLIIDYSTPKTKPQRTIMERVLKVLIRYLKEIYERTESLSRIWSEPEYLRKITYYQLYRECYFLSLRLPAIENIKREVPLVQELLNLVRTIAEILSNVYEFPKEREEKTVDEFIT